MHARELLQCPIWHLNRNSSFNKTSYLLHVLRGSSDPIQCCLSLTVEGSPPISSLDISVYRRCPLGGQSQRPLWLPMLVSPLHDLTNPESGFFGGLTNPKSLQYKRRHDAFEIVNGLHSQG